MSNTLLTPEWLVEQLGRYRGAGRWLVALSGGMDSTVLLHLLSRARSFHPGIPRLSAIHVNHQIHSSSDQWQQHCRHLCQRLDVALIEESVALERAGDGLEAAARRARYAVFEQHLEVGDLLLMAHHLDDQVETLMLRLMRGTGLAGLGGMPVQRPLGNGTLLRPLLSQPRASLSAYAEREQLTWLEDPSNADTRLDRNFLRHEILPRLESRWPGYRQTASRAVSHLSDAARLLDEQFPAPKTLHSRCGDPGLALSELQDGQAGEAALRLRGWLLQRGLPMPAQARLSEFLRQIGTASEDSQPQLEGPGYCLRRFGNALFLVSEPIVPASLTLTPGEIMQTSIGEITLSEVSGAGFVVPVEKTVTLEFRQGGERIRLAGSSQSTSLKKLLQEEGVPPWWRPRLPLAAIDGEYVDVGGYNLCDSRYHRTEAGAGEKCWRLAWQPKISAH